MELRAFIDKFDWNSAGDFQSISWSRTAKLENVLIVDLQIWPFWMPETLRKHKQSLRLIFRNVVEMKLEWFDLNTELSDIRVGEISAEKFSRNIPPNLLSVEIDNDKGETRVICHEALVECDGCPV